MYTGSMYGKSAMVFAVWGYAISHMRIGRDEVATVELNPAMLAGVFTANPEDVMSAIVELEQPDPVSRHEDDEGRRIVLLGRRGMGPMLFRVVNGKVYRNTKDERAATESKRKSQAKWRAKKRDKEQAELDGEVFDEERWDYAWEQRWDGHDVDRALAVQRPLEVTPGWRDQ